MRENLLDAWTDVHCLRPYHPYRYLGERNARFSKATDGRLLDFKEGQAYAIEAEAAAVRSVLDDLKLPNGAVLSLIPGHEESSSNAGRPLARLIEAIVKADPRYVAGIDGLVRIKSVPKKAEGGSRDPASDEASIECGMPSLIAGAIVVLIDDTATTKGSVASARTVLLRAGAARVGAIAIGCTVKYI